MGLGKPYIAIEGNVGSGKTTVLNILRMLQPSFLCVDEPVALFESFLHYNPLMLSYEDPIANAAIAQHHMIDQSCQHYNKSLQSLTFDSPYHCAISERSVLSPMAFIQVNLMNKIFSPFVGDYLSVELFKKSRDLRFPDILIYFDVSAEECYKRTLERGRDAEMRGCTFEFLQRLETSYKAMLERQKETTKIFLLDIEPKESPEAIAQRVLSLINDVVELN